MKQLSIEEKAKRYDEAIDKVAHFIKKHIGLGCIIHPNSSEAKELFNIFPELKESEDERIRGAIIDHLKDNNLTEWAAWLEKQGKNNMGISEATKQKLKDKLNKALEKETPKSWNEFLDEQNLANSTKTCKPYGQRQECFDCQFNYAGECKGLCVMKRNEQKPTDEEMKELLRTEYEKGRADAIAEMQKPWSEEDEDILNTIINHFKVDIECTDEDDIVRWLKSLKDRYAWKPSEEDEELKNASISYLCNLRDLFESRKWDKEFIHKCINWLRQMK